MKLRNIGLKAWETALILAFIAAIAAGCVTQQQAELSDKLIRLHVVANSDTDEDQALKLLVRDGILELAGDLTPGCRDAGEAIEVLSSELDTLCGEAERILRENGCELTVAASLEREYCQTTEYDSFTLPAGNYTSLRLKIGEAEGKNWWCVVFPPLCTTGGETAEAFSELGLDGDEVKLITGDGTGVVIRFKLLEWVGELFG